MNVNLNWENERKWIRMRNWMKKIKFKSQIKWLKTGSDKKLKGKFDEKVIKL